MRIAHISVTVLALISASCGLLRLIVELFQRSQGVQVLRDGMYRLCEAYLNEEIDKETYADQLIALITTLDFVVPIELCTKSIETIERREGTASQRKTQEIIRDCVQGAYISQNNEQALHARKAKYEKDLESLRLLQSVAPNRPATPSSQISNSPVIAACPACLFV